MVMKLYCGYCGKTWEVYSCNGDLTRARANECPHCGAAAVKPETWAEAVSCLRQAEAVNQKLFMDHIDDHNALFRVSFLSDHQFYRPDLI